MTKTKGKKDWVEAFDAMGGKTLEEMTKPNKRTGGKKIKICPPHNYQYQLMSKTVEGGISSWEVVRRILYCSKCGDIKDIKL